MACHNLLMDSEKYRNELQQMQYLWHSYGESPSIVTILEECFSSAENPYIVALSLMANTEDFHLSKKTSLPFCEYNSTIWNPFHKNKTVEWVQHKFLSLVYFKLGHVTSDVLYEEVMKIFNLTTLQLKKEVMKTFKNWMTNQKDDLKSLLTADIKLNSFFVVNQQKNIWLVMLVAEIYCLADENEMFLSYIQEQVTNLKFKQACESAAILKLHRHFTIKDFLIQLIFQDKLTVVENFLKDSPEHQGEIVKFMDELLANGDEFQLSKSIQSLVKELKINDVKLSKFKPKCVTKLIGRYLKTYDVSPDLCPNYSYQQNRRALGFMIAKRFIDKTLEGESWNEMMLDLVKDNVDLQLKLIDILIDYAELNEAFHWFRHFKLDMKKLPSNLKIFCKDENCTLTKETETQNNEIMEESWDDDPQPSFNFKPSIIPTSKKSKKKTKNYCSDIMCDDEWDMETSTGTTTYQESDIVGDDDVCDERVVEGMKNIGFEDETLQESITESESLGNTEESVDRDLRSVGYHSLLLHEDNIVIIDEPNGFQHLMEVGIKDGDIVGLDCEWKPSFTTKKNGVALMQLATRNKVYLLDVLALSESCIQPWVDFNINILENERIIKIGFDIGADRSMVLESMPPLKGFGGSSFLDLSTLWKVLINGHSFRFPNRVEKEQSSKSLSHLVYLCFGKGLDKSDQFSNWEKRPLRRSQKVYAALDAYCLLEVYDFLKNSSFEQNIVFEEVVSSSMKEHKTSHGKRSKGKGKERKTRKPFDPMSLLSAQNVEVISKPPIAANSIKMVCDAMVQGLGRKLRSCGVDTWLLQQTDSSDTCVKVALRDQRVILTRGINYRRYLHYVDPANCYSVQSDPLEEQIKEVLRYFNIVLKEEDIFSRCQICNGREFAEVHNSLMKRIVAQVTGVNASAFESASGNQMGETKRTTGRGKRWSCPSVREWRGVATVTHKGAPVKCHIIPVDVLLDIEYFYVCDKCGKVYWDGSHFQNELNRKRENNLID